MYIYVAMLCIICHFFHCYHMYFLFLVPHLHQPVAEGVTIANNNNNNNNNNSNNNNQQFMLLGSFDNNEIYNAQYKYDCPVLILANSWSFMHSDLIPMAMTTFWPHTMLCADAETNGYCKMGCPWTSFPAQPLCWWTAGGKLPRMYHVLCVVQSLYPVSLSKHRHWPFLCKPKHPYCRHIIIM